MKEFFKQAYQLSQGLEPYVVVTMVSSRGHAPQDPGAKALITKEGLCYGTIGGGKVEARAIQHARLMLQQRPLATHPIILQWNLQKDIGMSCGGEASFLFEVHNPLSWPIVIFGAGHVAQALVRALIPLRCQIFCYDQRPEWIAKLPTAENLTVACTTDLPAQVSQLSSHCFFVVMTQGHATDVPILKEIFKIHASASYVGVLGSDVKSTKIRRELVEHGIDKDLVEKLKCPMGIQFGNNDPAEIAVSIVAELIQSRDLSAQVLQEKPLPKPVPHPQPAASSVQGLQLLNPKADSSSAGRRSRQ